MDGDFQSIAYSEIDLEKTELLLKQQGLLLIDLGWFRAHVLIAQLIDDRQSTNRTKPQPTLMQICLRPYQPADRPALRKLAELYSHDFSELTELRLKADGHFLSEAQFEQYFIAVHCSLLIECDGQLAGFAMVADCSQLTGEEGIYDVLQFFVLRGVRRHGVGAEAARQLFDRFPGRWEVRQIAENLAAQAFWRRVIADYSGSAFSESTWEDEQGSGVVQRFQSPALATGRAKTQAPQLIWLNGAFGAGKTTLAAALQQAMPGAVQFDPEEIGSLLQNMLPPTGSGDFQDLPAWRELVSSSLITLSRHAALIIVPMTLVEPAYQQEIFGRLRAAGLRWRHVFLHVSASELQRRINTQQLFANDPQRDERVRSWRLAQIERGLAAAEQLTGDTLQITAEGQTVAQLVNQLLIQLQKD